MLLADSGSTKTDWCLILDKQLIKRFQTQGFNPYFVSSEEMAAVLRADFPAIFDMQQTEQVFFYGAGCSSPAKQEVIATALRSVFKKQVEIAVEHDMLAAGRALFGKTRGIASILGTGSNSCLYDGDKIVEDLFSLGYMFGDEGSGAHLGKSFIALYLKKKVPAAIREAFQDFYALSDEEILTELYKKANPNRFLASFSVFLKAQLDNPFIYDLTESCFDAFFVEQVSQFTNYRDMPFGCIGSVGFHFREVIQRVASRHGVDAQTFQVSPMEGLIGYHAG